MFDLEQARDLVKIGNVEALELIYGNVSKVLSELIRTVFIPKPGYKFVVSDFSATEDRVIVYLPKESWRSEVFRNGGDFSKPDVSL